MLDAVGGGTPLINDHHLGSSDCERGRLARTCDRPGPRPQADVRVLGLRRRWPYRRSSPRVSLDRSSPTGTAVRPRQAPG
jgi:hypothetical protein